MEKVVVVMPGSHWWGSKLAFFSWLRGVREEVVDGSDMIEYLHRRRRNRHLSRGSKWWNIRIHDYVSQVVVRRWVRGSNKCYAFTSNK